MERLEKDFLNDVFDFTFAAGVAAGGGEDARLVLFQQRLEAGGVTTEHSRDQFRVSSFHSGGIWHSYRRRESGKPPRERGGFPVNPNQPLPESFWPLPVEDSCLSAGCGCRCDQRGRQGCSRTCVFLCFASFQVCSLIPPNNFPRRRPAREGYRQNRASRCTQGKVWEVAGRLWPERKMTIYSRVIWSALSNSSEKCLISSRIFCGCSVRLLTMRSIMSGFRRISSSAATIRAR